MAVSAQQTPRLPPLNPAAELVFSGFSQIFQLELRDILKLGVETLIPDFIQSTLDDLINEAINVLREHHKTALIEINQGAIVVGDIHGNLTDLVRILLANGLPPVARYLFLGDFVDRGPFSIEVISLILALKVLYPECIYIIRGNHEVRDVNRIYGFHDEIEKQYETEDLWEHFNTCFEYFPIAAILKQKYFCVHGGIAKGVTIQSLKNIELPITKISGMISDLLWSDPNESIEAYSTNPRGTGCEFGFMASLAFLKQSNLDFIVRGHQCIKEGVNVKSSMNVITVFSSSRYHKDARPNVCGFMLVKEDGDFDKFSFPDIEILVRENANFFKVLPDTKFERASPAPYQRANSHSMISLTSQQAHTLSFSMVNTRKILQAPTFAPGGIASRGSVIRRPSMPKLSIPNVQGGLQSVRAVSKINVAKITALQVPAPAE